MGAFTSSAETAGGRNWIIPFGRMNALMLVTLI
jgi:hypothetical protein